MPETESARLNRKLRRRRWHNVYSIEVDDTCADPKGMSSWKVKGRTGSGGRCGGCEGRRRRTWSELRSWPAMWAIGGCLIRTERTGVIEARNDEI